MYKMHGEWEGMDWGWLLGCGDIEGGFHGVGWKIGRISVRRWKHDAFLVINAAINS